MSLRTTVALAAALACGAAAVAGAQVGAPARTPRQPSYLHSSHHEQPPPAAGLPLRAPSYDVPVMLEGGRAGTAYVSRTGLSTWEPTIGVDAKNVYVQVSGPGNKTSVARSKDNGRTWQVLAPSLNGRHPHENSLDPYLHVDPQPTGTRLYLADATGPCSFLSASGDGGSTWSRTGLACGPGANDHQNVFTGRPVITPAALGDRVLYYCYNALVVAECIRSLDGGTTFLPPGAPPFTVADPSDGTGPGTFGADHVCFTPSVGQGVTGPDGTVYLPRGHCGQPWLAISRDEGMTWTRSQVAPLGVATIDNDPNHEAEVAVAADGTVYYGWLAANRFPYVAWSTDRGLTWSAPMRVPTGKATQTRIASMTVAADGTVVMIYLGSTDAPTLPVPGEDEVLPNGGDSDYAKATWHGFVATARVRQSRPSWRSTQINPQRDPLVRGQCHPNRCTRVGDFLDVQVHGRTAWAAFVDACTGACVTAGRTQADPSEALVVRVPLGPAAKG